MDVLYYLSGIIAFILMIAIPVGIIKPNLYQKLLKSKATRKSISLIGISTLLFVGTIVGVTEPASVKQARLEKERASQASLIEQQNKDEQKQDQPVVEEKVVTEEQVVAFSKEQKEDSSIPKGESRVTQAGVDGKKTLTYKVKYEGGRELSRQLISEAISVEPTVEITSIGTYVYVAPKPAPRTSSPAPSSPSGGRTGAICRDGTRSNATGRGACSHHGGVDHWLY